MRIFLGALLGCALASGPADADTGRKTIEFHISTNEPVICVKDEKLDCIAGRLVVRACELAGLTYQFTDRPWKRAEEEIAARKGNAFFLMTGKSHDSDSIDWFFFVYSDEVWLYSLKPLDADTRPRPGSIGVRRGSPFDQIAGLYDDYSIYALNDWRSGALMLKAGRLEAILATRLVIEANIARSQILVGQQGYHQTLGRMSWYIVRDANTPPTEASEQFRQGLSRAKAEPWFTEMLASYGVSPEP